MPFSDELKYWIHMHFLPACKLAEWAGISPQSLSRFRDSSGRGSRQKGLETPTLERLWKAMRLYIQIPDIDDLLFLEYGEQLAEIKRKYEANVITAGESVEKMQDVFRNFHSKYSEIDSRSRSSFCDQLRCVIRRSGIRPRRIAKEAGVDASVLSLFLAGRRGLSMASIDGLWEYFGLRITTGSGDQLPPELSRYIPPDTFNDGIMTSS